MRRVRKYQSRDFVDYVATLEKTRDWKRHTTSELQARLEKLKRREQVWLAEVETRAVGFMILSPRKDDSLEIEWLDVHPGFQRSGLGTLLVNKAARIVKAKKMLALSMHFPETNKTALGFATKNGFVVFERVKDFYGNKKDALHLRKMIL